MGLFYREAFFSVFGLDHSLDYEYGWFKLEDIGELKKIRSIPEFVGGIYYVRKAPELEEFMNTVRYIHNHYFDYKFRLFNNYLADETVFALTMAVHNQTTVGINSPNICFIH